ncbi:ribosome maturation factor RimM [Sphingomonas nostoxanthinifaciens]|uniref:ribosome maturation factor RimM n=1 Tax=Sphingomonas nostoxanthinifaciens TaxID=2872652 RepID=UPI001CC1C84F|nr:ribosome maturation factor RimM [Sphingomonas nostoxanthinifaciens]UAK25258.1 ribosome maturation factor RimM [Sphingomonas nostoxanthinifaciens]
MTLQPPRSPAAASPPKNRPKAAKTPPPASPAPPRAEPSGAARTVTLAAVAGAHGIGGEVKLKLFTDDLSRYRSFNDGALTVVSLRGAIARFVEVRDRTAAEALRGTALTVPRDALPPLDEGEYYHADLIGLPCVSTDGGTLGTVVLIDNFGAGDVLEIEQPDGKRFMVPMRPDAVPEWNDERLVVDAAFVG